MSKKRTGKKSIRLAASALAAAVAVAPPSGEIGVDGVGNFAGDIYTESNQKLLYTEAYGSPGSRQWGEWEKLLRTNPFVAMGMDFVGGHVRDARIGLEAAEEVPAGQQHADFVHWALTEAMEPGISEVNQQMVEGLVPGFALHELVWGSARTDLSPSPSGYANVIERMAERLPSTMAHNAWHVMNGDLGFVRQQGPDDTGLWRTANIPAEKLHLATWKRKGNNFAGYSVFRPVWYLAKIQEQLLKLGGVSMVREGAGIPTATASDKATKLTTHQRSKLQRLLENLVFHENAAVVMPQGWSIDWVYSPGANKGHVWDAWQQLGTAILQMVQAQQLGLGVSGTGSRAVGTVHDSQSVAFTQGVIVWLEGVWNGVGRRQYTGVVKKLVDANFGPQLQYPRLTLTLKRPQLDPGVRLKALTDAVAAGAFTVTLDDENTVREDLGFAPIDEDVRDAEQAKATAAKAAAAPKFLPGAPGVPTSAQPTPEPEGEPPKKLEMAFAPKRALRPSETKLDLAALSGFLDSAPVEFEQLVRPVVAHLLVTAAPAITKAMADGKVTPAEVQGIPLITSHLEVAVGKFLAKVRGAGGQSAAKEIHTDGAAQLAKKRADGVAAVKLAAGDGQDDPAFAAITDADEVVSAQTSALVRKMENRLRGEIEREAIDVMRTGGDASEVVSRTLMRQLDTGAFKADAGSVTAKIFNVGRDEAARLIGGVASVERSAVLDNNVCSPCESRDGDTADFGTPEHDALVPPDRDCEGGDRCRCLLLFIPAESGPDAEDTTE